MFICLAIYAEMRQSACDVGNRMNFYCGFILSMLGQVDAPVSEFKSREIIHIGEAKATCLLRTNSDKVAKS